MPPPGFFIVERIGPSSVLITDKGDRLDYSLSMHISGRQADGGGWFKFFQAQYALRKGADMTPTEALRYVVDKDYDVLAHYYGRDGVAAIQEVGLRTLSGKPVNSAVPIEDIL